MSEVSDELAADWSSAVGSPEPAPTAGDDGSSDEGGRAHASSA